MKEEGHDEAAITDYKSKWESELTQMATFMIQSSFLVDRIAKEKSLRCTDEDVEEKLADYAKQTGIDLDRLREFYGEEDRMSRLRYQLTEEKVVQFLLSKAKYN